MIGCHSTNEDMFLDFCRQMAQICPHLCCFMSILKNTSNISNLASFYSSRIKCTKRLRAPLRASLYAFIIKSYKRADPEIIVGMRGRGAKPLQKEYLRVPLPLNHMHPFPKVCDLDNA